MPNDALRYEFIFEETMAFNRTMESNHSSIVNSISHTLRPGWNKIRVIVDRERQLFSIFTNDSYILSIDDMPIEETFNILIESRSAVDSAIDNFQLQVGVTADGEERVFAEPAEAKESISDDQGYYYFNDFNDYDPGDFELGDGYIGEVDGEVAIKVERNAERISDDTLQFYLRPLNLESYELRYDLYLDFSPEIGAVAINLMMPDEALRYKFFFADLLEMHIWKDNALSERELKAVHNLHQGWNEVRVVVDKDSQTV
jgi:hypothetical protein